MKWIKIEDKRPKDCMCALVLSVHNKIYACNYYDIEGFLPYAHVLSGAPIGKVTHWMYFPELPEDH